MFTETCHTVEMYRDLSYYGYAQTGMSVEIHRLTILWRLTIYGGAQSSPYVVVHRLATMWRCSDWPYMEAQTIHICREIFGGSQTGHLVEMHRGLPYMPAQTVHTWRCKDLPFCVDVYCGYVQGLAILWRCIETGHTVGMHRLAKLWRYTILLVHISWI